MVSVRASVCVRTGVSARRQGGLLNAGGAEKEGKSGMGGESILCVEVRNRGEREREGGGKRKRRKKENTKDKTKGEKERGGKVKKEKRFKKEGGR